MMKKRIQQIFASFLLVAAFSFVATPMVSAADPADVFGTGACSGGASICPDKKSDDLFDIIKVVINVMLIVAGAIAVIMIIIGGMSYILSSGEQAKVKQAKDTILYAVIGLVVALSAFAIVNFVVGKL